jgi:hypothetical protein
MEKLKTLYDKNLFSTLKIAQLSTWHSFGVGGKKDCRIRISINMIPNHYTAKSLIIHSLFKNFSLKSKNLGLSLDPYRYLINPDPQQQSFIQIRIRMQIRLF